jgi:hypothetical protein
MASAGATRSGSWDWGDSASRVCRRGADGNPSFTSPADAGAMRQAFVFILVLLVLVVGAPRVVTLLNWLMGSRSGTAVEADGSVTTMESGQSLPPVDWVPVLPDATVVESSRITSKQHPQGFFILVLSSRASLEEVQRFYTERLTGAGFTVSDYGVGTLTPAGADYLGLAGTLVGERPATNDKISVQIRTPEGVIWPSRLVQIKWWKLSAAPDHW